MTEFQALKMASKYGDVRGGGPVETTVSFSDESFMRFVSAMLAAPSPSASSVPAAVSETTPAEYETAIATLRHVIECLRKTGRYIDDEGEATDYLEPLVSAPAANPAPSVLTDDEIDDIGVAQEIVHVGERRKSMYPISMEDLRSFARALLQANGATHD